MHIKINGAYNGIELLMPVSQIIMVKETTNDRTSYKVKNSEVVIHITEQEYNRITDLLARLNMYEADRFNAIQKAIGRGSTEQIDRSAISALMRITLNDD